MSELVLARIQFASTTLFHFLFVPMSIGLVFMVALMETLYLVKKNELYLKMAKFWGHLFLINFFNSLKALTPAIKKAPVASAPKMTCGNSTQS